MARPCSREPERHSLSLALSRSALNLPLLVSEPRLMNADQEEQSLFRLLDMLSFPLSLLVAHRVGFECPTCLATQTIKLKGGRVKFSWHPKRTTNTPNHGLRWVERESTWRLAQ